MYKRYINSIILIIIIVIIIIIIIIIIICAEAERGCSDATRDTNKLYVQQKLCDYHYYQYTRPNRTKFIS